MSNAEYAHRAVTYHMQSVCSTGLSEADYHLHYEPSGTEYPQVKTPGDTRTVHPFELTLHPPIPQPSPVFKHAIVQGVLCM